jgi:S1-C subfamily serine protease
MRPRQASQITARRLANPIQIALLVLCACISIHSSAFSQSGVHEQIRKSLVFIEMKGETDNGIPLGSAGTGFLVSDDGYILTCYHLLEALSKSRPEKIEVWVHFGERKQAADKRAFVVDGRVNLDLLLLKVSRTGSPYISVKTGSARRATLTSSIVLSSGFRYQESPPDANYTRFSDQITSEDGPAGYTWVLNNAAVGGQSGSPVYTESGIVIGILKGNFAGQTVFVPLEHAATLLLPLQLTGDTR